jgi:hypothetical protein
MDEVEDLPVQERRSGGMDLISQAAPDTLDTQ